MLEPLLRYFLQKLTGYKQNNTLALTCMAYADDTILFINPLEELQRSMQILIHKARDVKYQAETKDWSKLTTLVNSIEHCNTTISVLIIGMVRLCEWCSQDCCGPAD
jgi:hypothetical protein